MSNHFLLDAVLREVERQDSIHREGYPATRDGVRLGIATIQDELDEALNEWRNERRMPRWTDTRGELIQVVGVGLRLLRSLYAHEVEVSRENAARQAEYNASGEGSVDVVSVPDDDVMCVCGHTAHWHAFDGGGDCEGTHVACEGENVVPPGSFATCQCEKFQAAREVADVQADVNVILDTLLTGERLVAICHEQHDSNKGLVIEFALDAVARLRKDAVRGVTL